MAQVGSYPFRIPADRLDLAPITPAELRERNPFAHDPQADPPGPYRVGELSRLSGVAVGTIKYYLREGLLPPGQATAKTQALYDHDHLRRLRLVRVMADVGGLSIAEIKALTNVLDGKDPGPPGGVEQAASYAVGGTDRLAPGSDPQVTGRTLAEARQASDAFVDGLGFVVDPSSPARAELAESLQALRLLGYADDPIVFSEHARLAYELGAFEIENSEAGGQQDPTARVEEVMVGSVVFGAAFMALRRMAHEHEVRRRYADPEGT